MLQAYQDTPVMKTLERHLKNLEISLKVIIKNFLIIVLFYFARSQFICDKQPPKFSAVCWSTAKVITDRATGRSKGFGFVAYETIEEAEKAREGMNAKFLDGWVIFVDPAKPSMPRRPPPPPPQDPLNFGITTNKTVGWTGRWWSETGAS